MGIENNKLRVLLVGSGGREHAIAWKLAQSLRLGELFVAPGNAGTAAVATNVDIAADDVEALLKFVQDNNIDFTVVGPEAPLAKGIVDTFQKAKHPIFGPSKNAARIETSKAFAKQLMQRNKIPTAPSKTFTDAEEALRHINQGVFPLVVKADGLAAGKGVIIARDRYEANEAIRDCIERRIFGDAGNVVLVEEFLQGEEMSVFAFVDGERISSMVAARDYKRVRDGDDGPNTGGMGSFSPPSKWNAELEARVRREIMEPTVKALAKDKSSYRGVLYAGLMLTDKGPYVLEFNARMGDPETQAVLPRLKSDLLQIMLDTARGDIANTRIEWDQRSCVAVVLASGGYPGHYIINQAISGLDAVDDDVTVFHAGTRVVDGKVATSGGRVLAVAALGDTIADARARVYKNTSRITFNQSFHRSDIAAGI
ncbi:MAG: phosphoribosylamine--glycine ligase [Chloroflexi bacterium]|nr:phosphoribosylamine--glycine ligase [Chloroflexota bacterium]